MDMAFAFLADHAAVPPDGKLYVLGGGINMLGMPEIPGRAAFDVVGGFRFSPADAHSVHTVELRLLDADRKLVIPRQRSGSRRPRPSRRSRRSCWSAR